MPRLSSRETPLTLILIGASLLIFLLDFFTRGEWLRQGLALTPQSVRFVWTWLTWPLLEFSGITGIFFTSLWVWVLGGSMERAWGSVRLIRFFLATTLVTTLTVLPTLFFLPHRAAMGFGGLSLGFAPVALAWCWINRRETILFSFVVPIPALWIAALTVALTFFGTATLLGNPWAGFAGLSGCAAAWWWVRSGKEWCATRFGRHKDTPNPRFADLDRDIRGAKPSRNPLKKAREERARLERDKKIAEMFRNSGYQDDER